MLGPKMRLQRSIFALGACAAACVLGACVGYGTYPKAGGQITPSGVNSAAAEEAIAVAARWVIDRRTDLVEGEIPEPVVVSLPAGTKPWRVRDVIEEIGPPAVAATDPNLRRDLPVYRVGRVALRGSTGEVDVYRPVFQPPDGREGSEPVYQLVTLQVEGGVRGWRVERARPWTAGAFTPPAIVQIPPLDASTPAQDALDGQ